MRYLDPKNHFTFYEIFGKHSDILIDFLNAILRLEGNEKIISLDFILQQEAPKVPLFVYTYINAKCTNQLKKEFIIELQVVWRTNEIERIDIYHSLSKDKTYLNPILKNRSYSYSIPVYVIGLSDEIFDYNSENYYHFYKNIYLTDSETEAPNLNYLFIELPKIKDNSNSLLKNENEWLRFLTEIEHEPKDDVKKRFENEYVLKAIKLLEESYYSTVQLRYYDDLWDSVRTEKALGDEYKRLARGK
jgi:hypothetical protein